MPRFFFDVMEDDQKLFLDTEGTDLPGLDDAGVEATQALAEIVRDALPGHTAKRFIMKVRQGEDELLRLELDFRTRRMKWD